jgi:hypothetical protein
MRAFSTPAAEAISAGAAATIPYLIIPPAPGIPVRAIPVQVTPVEGIAEEAMAAVAAAINAAPLWTRISVLSRCHAGFLDSFQFGSGISLESLEKTLFPFASCRGLKYRWALAPLMGSPF